MKEEREEIYNQGYFKLTFRVVKVTIIYKH